MLRVAVIALIAAVAAALTFVSAANAGRTPRLTRAQAISDVRAVIDEEFDEARARSIRCRRLSRTRQRCQARWRYILRNYRGTITITRRGERPSPIDRYRLNAVGRARFLDAERVRRSGRVVVETRRARLGQTLRVLGQRNTDLEVTAGPITDPFTNFGQFEEPEAGTRWVVVELLIRNVGRRRYDDSIGNTSRLLTTDDRRIETGLGLFDQCPGQVEIPPREQRRTCATFEVPDGQKLREYQFRADSGTGDETGVWRIGG